MFQSLQVFIAESLAADSQHFELGQRGHFLDVGIRVVGVNPGPVTTDRMIGIQKKKAQFRFGDEARWVDALSGFAFGRAATPDEIANAIAFVASPLSAYTSGAILTIDGGASAGRAIP